MNGCCATDADRPGGGASASALGAITSCFRPVGSAGRCSVRLFPEDHSLAVLWWVDEEVRDQGGPAGLMHGAEPGAVVAVEVLVEQQVVLPPGIGLHAVDPAVDGPSTVRTGEPDTDQPVCQVSGDRTQCQLSARSGGVFDGE